MSFVIKQFGRNTACADTNALHQALQQDYADSTISVVRKQPSGVDKVVFIKTDEDGNAFDSYTGKPVHFA